MSALQFYPNTAMNIAHQGEFNLTGLSKINVLLRKNGSGTSTLLKKVESRLMQQATGKVNYVTPERGGNLRYEAGVEQNVITGGNWTRDMKGQNQWGQFKKLFSCTISKIGNAFSQRN